MSECDCGSGKNFSDCCEPIIVGDKPAVTAEALMRARYAAYVHCAIDFLGDSLHPDFRHDWDESATRRWAESAQWHGLRILGSQAGGPYDEQGMVEFIAEFTENGQYRQHHEISRFLKWDGRWYYADGAPPKPQTMKREGAKVGRNEPCPCGSGKKYKKCCGV